MNKAFSAYGITDKMSLAMLLATSVRETSAGADMLQDNGSGAGLLQVTGINLHDAFLATKGHSAQNNAKRTQSTIVNQYPYESAGWYWNELKRVNNRQTIHGYIRDNARYDPAAVFFVVQTWVASVPQKGVIHENGRKRDMKPEDMARFRDDDLRTIKENWDKYKDQFYKDGGIWKIQVGNRVYSLDFDWGARYNEGWKKYIVDKDCFGFVDLGILKK